MALQKALQNNSALNPSPGDRPPPFLHGSHPTGKLPMEVLPTRSIDQRGVGEGLESSPFNAAQRGRERGAL